MNVLIVDDNPTNLQMFKLLVGRFENCTALTFAAPAEALAWCEHHTPDLILLDYMMPDIDGIMFLERFRALPGMAEIPVIMITADIEKDVRHRALEAGANDFLTKPIDKTEFLARMKNTLALRRGQKQLANRAAWLAEEVKKALAEVAAREREAIFLLTRAAEYRDPETGAHILRMAHYSRLIGEALGLAEDELDLLLEAAPMHDIGKVGIPDAILLKPGKLDDDEFAIMKRHAEIGHQILQGHSLSNRMLRMAAEIAISHHEKFDGTGYPRRLAGEAIPLSGRIVAVADVFDALTSPRPYKRAWRLEEATAFLREQSGKHFDPACVEAFFSVWEQVLEIRERFKDEEDAAAPI
ncbi:MAG: response regulator [Rhodocyclaceae bacterium]|nr:response regulator [Rhodocyclaceae bacterium]